MGLFLKPILQLLVIALLLFGCGQTQTSNILSPATPEVETNPEPSNTQPAPESSTQPEAESEPEPEPEPEPIQVWTAPEGETLDCENTQIPFTFNPSNPDYSLNNAFWTMWFAKRSFTGGEQSTQDELAGLGFTDYQYIENEVAGMQALITANETSMVIAFQGSKQIIDWFANFYFFQADASYDVQGRVHQGFANVLNSEWAQIMETVERFHRPGQAIWLSGHSLGAALATITAARLLEAGYDIAPLFTHASPRVGDELFAQNFYEQTQGKHYRFVNGVDIVPHLPPAGTAAGAAANFIPLGLTSFSEGFLADLGYTHAGQLYRIETDGALTHFPGLQEDEDNDYWSNLNIVSLFDMIVSDAQEALHNENSYLCKMRDLWLAN
ncbi:MAG: lipase family protein [Deltaproteobacteria bacterium]|jgi:triacylglycerol lipase|nr:lipase family protein [Deltaproteobacteria bacterium]